MGFKRRKSFINTKEKGLYILVLSLDQNRIIKAGHLSEYEFKSGIYLYVGKASNGLYGRIARHRRQEKKFFWHIDYFLKFASIGEIWIKPNCFDECLTVSEIRKYSCDIIIPVKKFGASDCRCEGHLLFIESKDIILKNLREKVLFERRI